MPLRLAHFNKKIGRMAPGSPLTCERSKTMPCEKCRALQKCAGALMREGDRLLLEANQLRQQEQPQESRLLKKVMRLIHEEPYQAQVIEDLVDDFLQSETSAPPVA